MPIYLPSAPFQERWPWLGPDLQTLRDSLMPLALPVDRGEPLAIAVGQGASLLALQDQPLHGQPARGLVLLLHGLGGSSQRQGVRRQALCLQAGGFAVWRLNGRGAGPGRPLAPGSYAASCNADLLPVLAQARRQAAGRPLLGVGLSLGGTMLLNALRQQPQALDGLVMISSPLDLQACSKQIEQPRNRLYQHWLLRQLVAETLADPFGVSPGERQALEKAGGPKTIRAFDAVITAPRWGYGSLDHYYAEASPLAFLLGLGAMPSPSPLPPTLILHAADDPWVPAAAAGQLQLGQGAGADAQACLQVCLTAKGGHNGFHGAGDGRLRRWSDGLTVQWLNQLLVGWGLGMGAA